MTLDSYKNFVAIVESGSILAAANKLLIAQPSLSNQLKNIEKNYGAQLLIRVSRSLELTDVNKIHIMQVRDGMALLKNNISLPISRSHLPGVKEQINQYWGMHI